MLPNRCPRALVLAGLLALAALAAVAPGAAAKAIPGQYIVVLKDNADVSAVVADHKRSAGADVVGTYRSAIRGYTARVGNLGLGRIKGDSRVAFVVQDQEGSPTLAAAKQPPPPPPPPPGGVLPPGVNRVDADTSSALAGNGEGAVDADVAVFDSGISTTHPDLNVVGGVNCLGSYGYHDGTYNDQFGHGSHVAGILAARDDANGVVGVAPGARLWAVRVLDMGGTGTTSTQLCGIDWVTANGPANGIKVVNSSQALMGKADDGNCGNTAGDVLHKAICTSTAAGITWVFAAGNTKSQYNNVAGASYNEVLAVTAMGDSNGVGGGGGPSITCTSGEVDDRYASFSSWASSSSDFGHTIAAPGVCVQSAWTGTGFMVKSGTSMAAPHATGAVLLCIVSGQCTGTPAEIIQKVRADAQAYSTANPVYRFTGDPFKPVNGRYYGHLVRAGNY